MRPRGQMLIEVVVAVGVLALVLVGITDLMTRSASLVAYQRSRDQAYSLARQQLISLRTERDLDNDAFFLREFAGFGQPCESNPTYTCKIEVEKDQVGEIIKSFKIKVTVSWPSRDPDTNYEVFVEEMLVNKNE